MNCPMGGRIHTKLTEVRNTPPEKVFTTPQCSSQRQGKRTSNSSEQGSMRQGRSPNRIYAAIQLSAAQKPPARRPPEPRARYWTGSHRKEYRKVFIAASASDSSRANSHELEGHDRRVEHPLPRTAAPANKKKGFQAAELPRLRVSPRFRN